MSALLKFAMLQPIEAGLNLFLKRDPHIIASLHRVAPDKLILLECTSSPRLSLALQISADRIHLLVEPEEPIDATIRGTRAALLGLLQSDDPAAALYHPELQLSGDVHLIQALHRAVTRLELQWQDLFDNPAFHLAASALTKARQQTEMTMSSLRQDTTDFLQQEAALLPSRHEIAGFQSRVDELRLRIDRLEARTRLSLEKQ